MSRNPHVPEPATRNPIECPAIQLITMQDVTPTPFLGFRHEPRGFSGETDLLLIKKIILIQSHYADKTKGHY